MDWGGMGCVVERMRGGWVRCARNEWVGCGGVAWDGNGMNGWVGVGCEKNDWVAWRVKGMSGLGWVVLDWVRKE